MEIARLTEHRVLQTCGSCVESRCWQVPQMNWGGLGICLLWGCVECLWESLKQQPEQRELPLPSSLWNWVLFPCSSFSRFPACVSPPLSFSVTKCQVSLPYLSWNHSFLSLPHVWNSQILCTLALFFLSQRCKFFCPQFLQDLVESPCSRPLHRVKLG